MAGIMHKTSRLMAAVLLGCLLAGCGGQLLSHREIVRAVFFTAQDAGYTVTLLTSCNSTSTEEYFLRTR